MYRNQQVSQMRRLLLAIVVTLFGLGELHVAHAAVPIVNSVSDDATVCAGAGVTCLREALAAANNGDVITFAVKGLIDVMRGSLTVSKNVTIQGPGTAALAVGRQLPSGTGIPFSIFSVPSGITVNFSGFTIQNGSGTNGGGINNAGALSVNNCVFLQNAASAGGGIYNSGTLTITKSRFILNDVESYPAGTGGGGLYNAFTGTATIVNSEFYLNIGSKAGVDNAGVLTVHGSTFWGNFGGGVVNEANGTATVDNSTFAGYNYGGADNYGTITITNSTFAGNVNAIQNFAAGAAMSLGNDLVAGNDASAPNPSGDIIGPVTSLGYNLVGNGDGATGIADGVNHDQVGTSSALLNAQVASKAADNGGVTQTLALQPGSPAIGKGNCAPNVFDQRGAARKVACDIGAFETQTLSLTNIPGGGFLNATYNIQLGVSGGVGPYTFALANNTLPGVTLSSSGLLSFSSATVGNYGLSVAVTDSQNHTGFQGATLSFVPDYNANQITVDTTLDSVVVGDSLDNDNCVAGCQLRTAVSFANRYDGSSINIAQSVQGVIQLWPQIGPDPVSLASGQLTIGNTPFSTTMKIQGPGAATLAVSALDAFGGNGANVFNVSSTGTLTISGLAITNAGEGPPFPQSGHGIFNHGILDASDMTFSNNGADGLDNAAGATATISSSTFVNNGFSYNNNVGDAINNAGQLLLLSSTISGNGSAPNNGAIYNGSGGIASIVDSTIAENITGTGIANRGTLTMLNSTVSGNLDGISNSGILILGSSVLSGNLSYADLFTANGFLDSLGYNVIQRPDDTSALVTSDQIGVDPKLGALGSYGGPTLTLALGPGSPAFERGYCAWQFLFGIVSTDQRGAARKTICDSGAYERLAGPIATIGVYRNGTFYLRLSNTTGMADLTIPFNPAKKPYPIVGDWTGVGFAGIGVFDQSNGLFLLRNADAAGVPDEQFVLGIPNDIPLAGMWQGGATHSGVGVFRPSNGLIYLKNALTTGFADYTMVLGIPGDSGIAGDWNGDGIASPGVYRPSNQTFYLTDQVTNGSVYGSYLVRLGSPGDVPLAGDWDGQGSAGVGLFRPTAASMYLKEQLRNGYADLVLGYGLGGDIPVAGHWENGGPVAPPEKIPLAPPNVLVPATPAPVLPGNTNTQPGLGD